jgi:hypothetical protein
MTKFRNANLRTKLAKTAPKAKLVAANAVPTPNTVNRSGHAAYAIDKWLRLITMLNTLKLENQFFSNQKNENHEGTLKHGLHPWAKKRTIFLTASASRWYVTLVGATRKKLGRSTTYSKLSLLRWSRMGEEVLLTVEQEDSVWWNHFPSR